MSQIGHIVTGQTTVTWAFKSDATSWQSIARVPVMPHDPAHYIMTQTQAVRVGKFTMDGTDWAGVPDGATINYARQRLTLVGFPIIKYPAMQIDLAVSGVSVANSGPLNANTGSAVIVYFDFGTPGFTVAQAKAGLVEMWLTAWGDPTSPSTPFQYE